MCQRIRPRWLAKSLPLLAVVILLLICAPAAWAQATTVTTTQQLPVTDVLNENAYLFTEACFGEPVAFSGSAVLVTHVTTLADGGTRMVEHINSQGTTATGLRSGARYRLVVELNVTSNTAETPPFHSTVVLPFNVLSPGAAPNLLVLLRIHTTVNARGETTSDIESFELACK